MPTKIGPRIGIDGEKQYRAEMQRIIEQAKTLDSEMNLLKTAYEGNEDALKDSGAAMDVLTRQIENQKELVRAYSDMLQRSAEKSGDNSTETLKWKQAVNNATAELQSMENELSGGTRKLDEFGNEMDEGGEAASTFSEVLRANLTSEAISKGLEKLADLAKKAAAALWETVQSSAAYADTYLTLSTTTGLSTDELQEFAYMSELVDVSLETMTGSMSKLIPQMSKAAAGNEDAAAAFASLGVNVTNADGSLRDSRTVFFEVIDALGKIEDPTARDAAAMDLFGRKAQDLNPLIEAGSTRIQELAQEAHDMGYVLDNDALDALGGVDDGFQRLSRLGEGIQNQLGVGMASTVTDLTNKLIQLAQEIDWESLGQSIGTVLGNIGDKVIEVAGKIDVAAIGEKIGGAFQWLSENGQTIITLIEGIGAAWATWRGVTAVNSLITQVSSLYGWLTKVGGLLGITGGAAAAGAGVAVLGAAAVADRVKDLQTIGKLGSGHELKEYADNLAYWEAELASAQQTFEETAKWGGDLTMAQDAVDTATNAVINARRELEEAQSAPAVSAEETQASVDAAAQAMVEGQQTVANGAVQMLQTYESAQGQLSTDFKAGADEMAQAAADSIVAANDALGANMAVLSGNATIWGTDMMISFANGIAQGYNDYVAPALEGVAGGVASYLEHSEPDKGPLSDDSTWMPDMMASFAKGIRDNRFLVLDQIRGLADAMRGSMDVSLGSGRGSSYNYGGVNVTFNVPEGANGRQLFEEFSYWLQNGMASEGAVFAQ